MKAIGGILLLLFVVGCKETGSGPGSPGQNGGQTCSESLDLTTPTRAAGSAYRQRVNCSYTEDQVLSGTNEVE
jgi:hypothetical protein